MNVPQRFARAVSLVTIVALTSSGAFAYPSDEAAARPNLYVVANEELANRIVARVEKTYEPVVDFILGARVRGESTATANVFLDFKPSDDDALLCFCLRTEIESDTVGVTRSTLTRTYGRHSLLASKPVRFDGLVLSTRRPDAAVVPRNFTRGVRTPVTGMPLVGPAVDQIVYREVQKRRTLSERIAAGKILDRAVPEFNRSIDDELAKLNIGLRETVRPALAKWHVLPDAQFARSTETQFVYGALLRSEVNSNANGAPATIYSNGSLVVAVHESYLNAAIDRQDLGGQTFPDRQLDQWINKLVASFQGSNPPQASSSEPALKADDSKPSLASIRFDADEPVRIQLDGGQLVLKLRIGIVPILGNEIPTQPITIPLGLSVRNGEVLLTPGKVKVGAADETDPAVPAIVRTLIGQQIESRLKALKIDGRVSIPAGESKSVAITVSELTAVDGWLVLKFD